MTGGRPDREQLIRELMARRGVAAGRTSGIPPRPPDAPVPLSPMQQGMWFIDRLSPANPAYLLSIATRLSGAVDPAVLRTALEAVVARHEALRTGFVEIDGVVRQRVVADARPGLAVEDRSAELNAGADLQATLDAVIATDSATGLDLGRPPLVRVRLARLGPDDHLLVVTAHHIVVDQPSMYLVMDEIVAEYHRLVVGGPAPAAPIQFPDYLVWQQPRQAARADGNHAFWSGQLAGFDGVLDLPTDRPRPAEPGFDGVSHPFRLDADLSAALDGLARDHGTTLFTVFLAALQGLLARVSGQDDVCVGSPVSLRSGAEQEAIVGLLVNSVPIRTDLSGDPTLAEVLDRARRSAAASLGHADLPFERIVELVGGARDVSRNPLFQTMLVVNPPFRPPFTPGGGDRPTVTARPVPVRRATARLDLTLAIWPGREVYGLIDYRRDLFEPATIARLGARLERLLRAMVDRPDQRLSTVDISGAAERAERAAWNATGTAYPAGTGLAELIAARATAAPLAPAVVDAHDGTGLTYGELLAAADALAGRLRERGVGPDRPVGVALPASAAAVTAVLGVLRAGGAYLPLDPGHPPARLRALLEDAGAGILVTDLDPPDGWVGDVVPVGGAPVPFAPPATHPDQLAYVIYTSGSTGRPKGVMVTHRTAANLTHAFADRHGIGPGDRLLMLPPLSFDASVGDLFPALAYGAAVVVHREPAAITGPGLLELCRAYGVTLVDTAAPLWARWVADLRAAPPATAGPGPLRAVMVGGEAVAVPTVRDWAALTGGAVTLYNHYGPTEATVCATTFATVDAAELPGLARLPIGRPVPNVRVHLLDADLREVPVGQPGEIHIGGRAAARGYLGAPGATAGRFVPDPFGDTPGARLYATGDLGRHRPDGAIEFLGRTDRQVKIRGYRIELGEVEAACIAVDGVDRAAVVAAGDRLVAYLVPTAGGTPTPAAVRAELRRRLPEHLVPSAFVVLADLPTNRHGKLDLAALPAPEAADDRPPYVAPRTPTEKALAAIWEELLGPDGPPVGAGDNFFDRGGHSLLAATVVAKVRAALGVELPLRALFDTADLAGLAALVDGGVVDGPDDPVAVLRADARLADDLVVPAGARPPAPPGSVLFTGATGFLGAYVLADWLAHTAARVHCLVRADDPDAAARRVADNLRRYGLWRPEYADRLVGRPGDLAAPALGLTPADFARLGAEVEAIVHNGGIVDFVRGYPALRPANVGGTLDVLRLAATGRPSAVHFVSTLGVFLTPAFRGGLVREGDRPDDGAGLGDGYNGSKWVADALVRAARARGLPVGIHRPARITGSSVTGLSNVDDFFSRLLKTFVQLGAVPDIDDRVDLAPVDYVGAGIGRLSRTGSTGDHHYYNNRTLTYAEVADALTAFGYPVTVVDYPRWRAALLARPDAALAGLAPLFGPDTPVRTQPDFDCSGTEAALAAAGIACPAADRNLLHTYLTAFVAAGFLTAPPGSAHG